MRKVNKWSVVSDVARRHVQRREKNGDKDGDIIKRDMTRRVTDMTNVLFLHTGSSHGTDTESRRICSESRFFFQLLSNEWHWLPISMLSLCCAAAGVSSPVGTSPALITIHSNKFDLNVTRWISIKDDLRLIFRWNLKQNLFAAPRQSFMSVDVTVVCFVSWRRESIWDPRSSFLVANAWRRLLASIGRVARPTGN